MALSAGLLKKEQRAFRGGRGRVLGGRVPDPAPGLLPPTPSPLGSCPAGPPGQTLDRTAPALSHRAPGLPIGRRARAHRPGMLALTPAGGALLLSGKPAPFGVTR